WAHDAVLSALSKSDISLFSAPEARQHPAPRTGSRQLSCRIQNDSGLPKDVRELLVHPEPAVSWHSGFRGGAHARPKATPVHHAARRRGGRVATYGASSTGWQSLSHRLSGE